LVREGEDLETLQGLVIGEPAPARSLDGDSLRRELGGEVLEGTKLGSDGLGERGRGGGRVSAIVLLRG
jgi:hypothetical protein